MIMSMRSKAISLCFIAICAASCTYIADFQEKRDKVRADLQTVCETAINQVPVNRTYLDTTETIKPEGGVITVVYEVESKCQHFRDEIYKHFDLDGWQPAKPGSPYYFKGKYILYAVCHRRGFNGEIEQFSLSCSWDKDGKDIEMYR